MAGGAGVRLWPLSRKDHPKQLLKLFAGTSLLRQSYDRVAALLPAEQIHVITSRAHAPYVADELPELPPDNIIGEPVGRDTAAAVGLAAALLHRRDPEALVGMFTADHMITPTDRFCETVSTAYDTAEKHADALVTMGIRPNRPDTNYGYVRRGDRIDDGVFEVKKFTEKPSVTTAMKYLASGEYYWNSGMFAWRSAAILGELKKQLPATHDAVLEVADVWGTKRGAETLEQVYPTLMKISIDFAVMERASRVLVVEMDCHWVDVGAWPALEAIIGADENGNVAAAPKVMHLGSRGCVVVSENEHLIATIGVDDLVIVHAPDATLICKRRDAAGIKELVTNIHEKYGDEYQ
jgi:mannose-1-phosphate guanylyltransferase